MPEESNPFLSVAAGDVASAFEFLFRAALNGSVEKVYEKEFIRAAAQAPDAEVRAAIPRLKKHYGHDFNITRFKQELRDARQFLVIPSHDGRYLTTNTGALRPVVANAITMMKVLPLRYNELAQVPEPSAPLPWGTPAKWSDIEDSRAAEWCQHQGLHIHSSLVAEAVQVLAKEHAYHPVRQYLEPLKWDGKHRLCTWLRDYGGAEDTELTREIGVRWMISGCARIMRPACQCDYTLVLEGQQGIRKSSALRALGEPWYTDDLCDVGKGHEAAVQIQGHWIVEIKELAAFHRTEWIQIKAWLDRREDKFRPAYGRRLVTFPRQNIFAASTNRRQWIEDDTGARRFWPILCSRWDTDRLFRDRDQLWAEAIYLYLSGEQWWLADDMTEMAAEAQQRRQMTDPWAGIVRAWAERPLSRRAGEAIQSSRESIVVSEVMEHCLGIQVGMWRLGDGARVESILRRLGYVKGEKAYEKG